MNRGSVRAGGDLQTHWGARISRSALDLRMAGGYGGHPDHPLTQSGAGAPRSVRGPDASVVRLYLGSSECTV